VLWALLVSTAYPASQTFLLYFNLNQRKNKLLENSPTTRRTFSNRIRTAGEVEEEKKEEEQ